MSLQGTYRKLAGTLLCSGLTGAAERAAWQSLLSGNRCVLAGLRIGLTAA